MQQLLFELTLINFIQFEDFYFPQKLDKLATDEFLKIDTNKQPRNNRTILM